MLDTACDLLASVRVDRVLPKLIDEEVARASPRKRAANGSARRVAAVVQASLA